MTRVYDMCIFPAPYHLGPKRQGCVCGSTESYPPGLQVKKWLQVKNKVWRSTLRKSGIREILAHISHICHNSFIYARNTAAM